MPILKKGFRPDFFKTSIQGFKSDILAIFKKRLLVQLQQQQCFVDSGYGLDGSLELETFRPEMAKWYFLIHA